MSYIITNDEYYKNISNILRDRLGTDYHYYPEEMPDAIRRIPQSIAGVDDVVAGIYLYDHDEEGYPTKLKVIGWSLYNNEDFPIIFKGEKLYSHLKDVEFVSCNFKYLRSDTFQNLKIEKAIISGCINIREGSPAGGAFSGCSKLKYVEFKEGLTHLGNYTFMRDSNLTTINLPSSLTSIGKDIFYACAKLEFVELGQGFNANNLVLSVSTKYSRETILSWLNALADRTGETTYKLTIGATNLKKLTEEDIAIATAKNWTLS